MKRFFQRKWIFYLFLAVGLIYATTQVSFPPCLQLRTWEAQYGYFSNLIYFLVSFLSIIFLFPRTPFVLLAGVCFGTWMGAFLSISSSVLAGWVCFKIGKKKKSSKLQNWLLEQKWFQPIEHLAEEKGLLFVLALRLTHVIHFGLSSYALAITRIESWQVIWGSLLGILPGTLAFTYASDRVGCAILSGVKNMPDDLQTQISICFVVFAIIGCFPLLLKPFSKKRISPHQRQKIHVQAHRGVCIEFQENTLPAFARAIELGADSIELDIHATRDNQIVVYHDFLLMPEFCTLNGKQITSPIPIRDLNYAQLKEYDCRVDRRLTRENRLSPAERRIPLLREVFELLKNSPLPHAKEMLIDIEIKRDPSHPKWSPSPRKFVKLVLDVIRNDWFFSRTVIRSFDPRITLVTRRKAAKKLTVVQLTNGGFVDYGKVIRRLRPHIIAPNHQTIQKEHVKMIHQAHIEVMPWTANTESEWKHLLELGVDGITTDDPEKLIEFLKLNLPSS